MIHAVALAEFVCLASWVLVGDAIGTLIIAPLVIGELEVANAPVVFVVLATLGLQPLATALGASLAPRRNSI